MTIEGSNVPATIVPVSEGDPLPRPTLDNELATLLDLAGMMSLTRPDSERVVVAAIAAMLGDYTEEIDANGQRRRARLAGENGAVGEDLALRLKAGEEQERVEKRLQELRSRRAILESSIADLEGQLVRRRHEAEDAGFAQQIAALRVEEEEAQRRALNRAAGNGDPQAAAANQRAAIALLEKKHESILAAETPALRRAETLAARSITQTVSGFLLWLGYGSVAATGAVLALMMNGGNGSEFGIILDGWRAIVESIPGSSAWMRLLSGVVLVASLLALVGGSIAAAERWLLKKRDDWNRDDHRKREPHVNLSPQSITRRTYTQFIAFLPFLFGAGIIATILAVTPARNPGGAGPGGSDNVITAVLPTLGYAFVGIVIAFLATAVFVMYVVRLVEPRERPRGERTSVLKAAWEFIIPPLVLVIAVAGTPFLLKAAGSGETPIVARHWVLWAGFMLLSSLALACGVVYHGIFKDARTARERIQEIESQLDLERGILAGSVTQLDEEITRQYGKKLQYLQGLHRDRQLARFGLPPIERRNDLSLLERALRWVRIRSRNGQDASPGLTGVGSGIYEPIDRERCSDLIAPLEKARLERDFVTRDIDRLERLLRRCTELTSFEEMLPLLRRRETLKGEIEASKFEDVERKGRAKVTGEVLTLHARSVIANGAAVKPFFEGVRADLAKKVPYAPKPELPQGGDSHE